MTTDRTTHDPDAIRGLFSRFPTGVVAVGTAVDDQPAFLVVSSFVTGVSMDPPLMMFAVQRTSTTWPGMKDAQRLGISFLSETQHGLARQLSSKDKDLRRAATSPVMLDSGAVFVPEAAEWVECAVIAEHAAGDHDIVVVEVIENHHTSDHAPLIFHRSAFTGVRGVEAVPRAGAN